MLSDLQQTVATLKGRREELLRQKTDLEKKLKIAQIRTRVFGEASEVLLTLIEEYQTDALDTVEGLMTQGLQAVFGEHYAFKIAKERKRGRISLSFALETTYGDMVVSTDLLGERGGGVLSVVGFLFRLVLLVLFREERRPFLALDETFANVSREYLPGLRRFVRTVADDLGIQIILVTHDPDWIEIADKAYRFEIQNGLTHVTELANVNDDDQA